MRNNIEDVILDVVNNPKEYPNEGTLDQKILRTVMEVVNGEEEEDEVVVEEDEEDAEDSEVDEEEDGEEREEINELNAKEKNLLYVLQNALNTEGLYKTLGMFVDVVEVHLSDIKVFRSSDELENKWKISLDALNAVLSKVKSLDIPLGEIED